MATPTVNDLGALSAAAYGNGPVPPGFKPLEQAELNGATYQVYSASDGTIVLAFKGTDPSNPVDQSADGEILAGRLASQAGSAAIVLQNVINTYASDGQQVVVTGHSLGGYVGAYAVSQYAAMQPGSNVSAVVFDSPSFGAGLGVSANGASITNIVMQGSYVSGGTSYLGGVFPGTVISPSYS